VAQSLRTIFRSEGLRGLQRGLAPACLLQFSNVGTRFGVYGLAKHICEITPETPHRYAKSLMLAGFSGCCAGLVSNPFFLLKTRLQSATSDVSIAVGKTQWNANMRLRDAVRDVIEGQGVPGFYRGVQAFVPRVMAASSVQLATYDVVKTAVCGWDGVVRSLTSEAITFEEGHFSTHFVSAWVTGLAVVAAMQPFDFAATRMMNDGRGHYSSSFNVLSETVRGPEGARGIYKGVTANYLRFGPYCILVFVFLEQFKKCVG